MKKLRILTVLFLLAIVKCWAQTSCRLDLSVAGTNKQSICKNSTITDIVYQVLGVSTSVNGLPYGVNGVLNSSGKFIISGSPSMAGKYTYTVTTTGGCSPDTSVTGYILVGIGLEEEGTNIQTVCKNTPIVDITYQIADGMPPNVNGLPPGVSYNYNSTSKQLTISGTPTVEGQYDYTVTTLGSCSTQSFAFGTIISGGKLDTNSNYSVQNICEGNSIDSIKYKIVGGSATVMGLPNGLTGAFSNSGSPEIYTITGIPTTNGIFDYTVTTTGTCTTQSSFVGTITVNPIPIITVNSPSICQGKSATLTASGGTSYTWNTGATTNTIIVPFGLSNSTYTVTGTAYDCQSTASSTVTIINCIPTGQPLNISIASTDASNSTLCNGTATAVVTGGTPPYSIKLGNTTVTDSVNIFTDLCTNFYTAKVTDAANDTASFTFVVGSTSRTFTAPNPAFVDSTAVDTLVTNAIQNCDIDYDAIDSIVITNSKIIGTDTALVNWAIFQADTVFFQNAFYQFFQTGLTIAVLDLFCTNRSIGIAKGIDQIYIKSTGIESYAKPQISIYPNPNNGSFTISSALAGNYSIINEYGQTVQQFASAANNQYTVNGNSLPAGIYVIVGDNCVREKIVVIK